MVKTFLKIQKSLKQSYQFRVTDLSTNKIFSGPISIVRCIFFGDMREKLKKEKQQKGLFPREHYTMCIS
jgi:hypothetical protein